MPRLLGALLRLMLGRELHHLCMSKRSSRCQEDLRGGYLRAFRDFGPNDGASGDGLARQALENAGASTIGIPSTSQRLEQVGVRSNDGVGAVPVECPLHAPSGEKNVARASVRTPAWAQGQPDAVAFPAASILLIADVSERRVRPVRPCQTVTERTACWPHGQFRS